MPIVPRYERQYQDNRLERVVSMPKPDAGVFSGSAQGLANLVSGLAGAGQQITQQAIKERADKLITGIDADMQNEQAEFTRFQEDLRANTPDRYAKEVIPARTAEFLETRRTGLEDKYKHSPLGLTYLSRKFGGFAASAGTNASSYAADRDRAFTRQTYENEEALAIKGAGELSAPWEAAQAGLQDVIAKRRALFGPDEAQEAGILEKGRAARLDGVKQGVVAEAISNPSAVLASTQPAMVGSIQDGSARWGEIAEIPQEFQQLFTPAEYVSLMSHAHEVAGRQLAAQLKTDGEALKSARENAEKELYEKGFNGIITRADVEAHRDILSPADYNRFLGMTSGANLLPEKSNPETIIALTDAAINGDPDLQSLANEALRSGQLTPGDYRAAIDEGQQFRDPVEKQVMEEIRLLTGYSDMNPNPAVAGNYVSAKRGYLAWRGSEAGQKATPRERQEMGSQLARNYRLDSEEDILSANIPFYLVGSRTAPDIESTVMETDKAYRGGKLTDEEYGGQMARIKKLNDLIEQRRAAGEAAESSRGGGK